MSVIVNNLGDCYNLDDVTDDYGNKFVVKDDGDRRYLVYFSDIFPVGNVPGCSGPLSFTLGVYNEEKMLNWDSVANSKNNYDTSSKFVFNFRDKSGNIIEELSVDKNIPSGINILSEDKIVKVVNSNGDIEELILNVRAWR